MRSSSLERTSSGRGLAHRSQRQEPSVELHLYLVHSLFQAGASDDACVVELLVLLGDDVASSAAEEAEVAAEEPACSSAQGRRGFRTDGSGRRRVAPAAAMLSRWSSLLGRSGVAHEQ